MQLVMSRVNQNSFLATFAKGNYNAIKLVEFIQLQLFYLPKFHLPILNFTAKELVHAGEFGEHERSLRVTRGDSRA